MVYFLNDVDDGGEVVLPLANSKFEVCRLTPLSRICLFVCLLMSGTELKKRLKEQKPIASGENFALLAGKCNI